MKWLKMRTWACIGGVRSEHRILVANFQERNLFGKLDMRRRLMLKWFLLRVRM
jgi:hypothetical protein